MQTVIISNERGLISSLKSLPALPFWGFCDPEPCLRESLSLAQIQSLSKPLLSWIPLNPAKYQPLSSTGPLHLYNKLTLAICSIMEQWFLKELKVKSPLLNGRGPQKGTHSLSQKEFTCIEPGWIWAGRQESCQPCQPMLIQHLLESASLEIFFVRIWFLRYYLLYELEHPYYSPPFFQSNKVFSTSPTFSESYYSSIRYQIAEIFFLSVGQCLTPLKNTYWKFFEENLS